MPKSEFEKDIEKLVVNMKNTSKTLDVSNISVEGMKETPEVGIPFNKALRLIEAAKELVDKAEKNLKNVLKSSVTSKSKRK